MTGQERTDWPIVGIQEEIGRRARLGGCWEEGQSLASRYREEQDRHVILRNGTELCDNAQINNIGKFKSQSYIVKGLSIYN